MAGRIPEAFIDELIARADIAEVIGARIEIKRAGREYKALCPFHGEKTPSFTISPDKGFYHCFGCSAHGTALGFIMEYENLSFVEAVENLADLVGLEVPRETSQAPTRERYAAVYSVLAEADQIFRASLKTHEPAVEYLKARGIDGATAAKFGMGFATDSWDALISELGGGGAPTGSDATEILKVAGLVIENESGRRYDRFRNRLMFPIRDHRGRVIGFGGRVLGDGEPKYLNSPETPVFHKGRALYGLYEARQSRADLNRMVVVEGYLDVASLAQHGIPYAVATLGTATTKDHIVRLTRLATRVVFCFDGDRAGRKAGWRALETALPHTGGNAEFSFLFLPDGEDPDSIVRSEGAAAFEARLDAAQPLSDFLVENLAAQVDSNSADGRARLATLAGPMLQRVPDGIFKALVLETLAEAIGLSADRLAKLMLPGAESANPAPQPARPMPLAGRSTLVRQAISLALHYPDRAAEVTIPDGLSDVPLAGTTLLLRLLETTRNHPQITAAGLLERFRDDPEGRHLGKLLSQHSQDEETVATAILNDCLGRILHQHQHQRLKDLTNRAGHHTPEEKEEYQRLMANLGNSSSAGGD
jgi:DNA primase